MRHKTDTKMMKVIRDYGNILRSFGEKDIVFLMTRECSMAVKNPDGLEFDGNEWEPYHLLPKHLANKPGVVGRYCGVLLVDVYNYNQRIVPQN